MRKVIGIILLAIGWLLALMTFLSLMVTIFKTLNNPELKGNLAAAVIGNLIGAIVIGLIPFFMIKGGIKLIKKKKQITEEILQKKIEEIN